MALLGLRGLLFGIAWKVIDFEVESALAVAGVPADQKRGWSIDLKRNEAKRVQGPREIGEDAWRAVVASYERTSELRHSLVHRRTGVRDQDGSLVGADVNGGRLRPMSVVERDAFGRIALLSASLMIKDLPRRHVERDLLYELHLLKGMHKLSIGETTERDAPVEIAVILDPDPDNPRTYTLHLAADLAGLKARIPTKDRWEDNLVLWARDPPEIELQCCLEDAPDEPTTIDFDNPPRSERRALGHGLGRQPVQALAPDGGNPPVRRRRSLASSVFGHLMGHGAALPSTRPLTARINYAGSPSSAGVSGLWLTSRARRDVVSAQVRVEVLVVADAEPGRAVAEGPVDGVCDRSGRVEVRSGVRGTGSWPWRRELRLAH